MNCGEFEHVLPDYLEGTQNPEQQAHLNSCRACSDLLSDLNLISSQAILLRASDEPSPRVWNSLESQLRREGIIHAAGVPQRSRQVAPTPPVQKVSAQDTVILNTVAAGPVAQRASYRADLDEANAFIRDAEQSVRNDPNDVYSQQLLINAYDQKQMLYDLAVDRSGGEQ
jgi:hypothetical protein